MNLSESELSLAQCLLIKGACSREVLASLMNLPLDSVNVALTSLEQRGALESATVMPDWLTLSSEAEGYVRASFFAQPDFIRQTYNEFEPLNLEFKAFCTDCQISKTIILSSLQEAEFDHIHSSMLTMLGRCGGRIGRRFDSYARRLEVNRSDIMAGDVGRLLRPLTDSYHDIWMDIHADFRLCLNAVATGV